jgi:uncharacterized protein (TIGR04255 family)
MEAAPMIKFSRTPVPEVHLHNAPLAKVLMQVQFSRTPQLVSEAGESAIADRLARYPVRRRQVSGAVTFAFNGQQVPLPVPPEAVFAVTLADATGSWVVSIADTSVSLETTDYATRDDFCARALELFQAVAAVSLPPVVDRVGMRYIDRLAGDSLGRLDALVIPQLRGLHGSVDDATPLVHSVTDSQIVISDTERLQVRSGFLPPGGAFDPSLPPLAESSWILDMDVFTTTGGFPFEPENLSARLREYADTAHSFFRFAVTDAFLDLHREPTAATTGGERP